MTRKRRTADKIEWWPTEKLKPDPRNSNAHPEDQLEVLHVSYKRFGWTTPCLIQPSGTIIAGEGRWLMASKFGLPECKVIVARGWSATMIQDYIIMDNQSARLSDWDPKRFREQLADIMARGTAPIDIGFTAEALDAIMNPPQNTSTPGSLSAKFGIPPFTVMNAREGWWQHRKSAWLALGIQSELGRGVDLIPQGEAYTRGRKAVPGGDTGPNSTYGARTGSSMVKTGKANAAPGPRVHGGRKGQLGEWRGGKKKANATPGGGAMPAANYAKNRKRGTGSGKPVGKAAGDAKYGEKL